MPQERRYDSNAQRQAAYRARLAERRALAGTDAAVEQLRELEAFLADAQRRAAAAEARVKQAEERQRASKIESGVRLQQALDRIADLKVVVAELHGRLAAAEPRNPGEPAQPLAMGASMSSTGRNRAERRRAERNERRGR